MNSVIVIVGIFIVLSTITDIIWTTLWVDGGAGPISNRLLNVIWCLLVKANSWKKGILDLAGPIILTLTLLTWILLLWTGWILIFAGGAPSIVNTVTGGAILWHDYVYFSAYVLFTLGNGDFSPANGFWQIMTSLLTGTGMMVLALAASYIISILGAVVNKRAFAASVFGIAETSEAFVLKAWNGKDFSTLDLLFNTLSSELNVLAVQHKAYPVLHYYHTDHRKKSAALALPLLDEALSMIMYGVSDEVKPNRVLSYGLVSSIADYLYTLNDQFISHKADPPPMPNLGALRAKNIPVVDEKEYENKMKCIELRRQMLVELLKTDNWEL